jgi:7 transmembrane receptor (rhodopsin family)
MNLTQVTVPVLFGTITVVGALGNFLVIYVILSREKMRTVTNLLLLNLAFADLAFVLVVPPFTSYQMAAAWWPFGDVACRLMHYSVNVTAYVTVYTLVVIAVMRYLTIVHNATTTWFRTRRVTVGLIVSLWAILLVVNVPVLLSYETRPTALSEDPTVTEGPPDCDLVSTAVGQRLFATFFAFAYLVPLTAIAILSVRILTDIRRQRDAMSVAVQRTSSHRRQQAVGRTLALVVGLFAALWLPVHVHLLVWFFGTAPTGRWYQVC